MKRHISLIEEDVLDIKNAAVLFKGDYHFRPPGQ